MNLRRSDKIKYSNLVLTGATGGIGEAIAKALDHRGYKLLLTGRDEKKLASLQMNLKGNKHRYVIADLTTNDGIDKLVKEAEEFGIDGVINCLGVNELATIEDLSLETINLMLSVNLLAPISICKALIPLLESRSEGVIINVGSILGSIGFAGSSVYCASKFGLRGFTESLRRELSDSSVAVVYLAPRATNTALNSDAMNQMNRALGNTLDEPEIVASHVVRVLRKGKSKSCYLGWPEKIFVRLNSLFPSLVDKALAKKLATIKRYCSLSRTEKMST